MTHYHTVILGGGFTGLATSRILNDNGVSHLVVDKADKLGSFLLQTWDSFRFGMTIEDIKLPGLDLSAKFPKDHRLTRDEALKIIEEYAAKLPVRLKTEVHSLKKIDGIFSLDIGNNQVITANHVVVCTGPHHAVKFPEWAKPFQHKSTVISHFKNANEYKENARVLVVGSGFSALTVAHDLQTGSKPLQVSLACGYDDKTVITNNSHLFKKPSPHLMQLLPSNLAKLGIINFGRIEETIGKEIIFKHPQLGEFIFPSGYFDHIILATGFTYSFTLFRHFPHIGVKNNLPEHENCETAEPKLYVAGIRHLSQQDHAVTIKQGSSDAKKVAKVILRSKL